MKVFIYLNGDRGNAEFYIKDQQQKFRNGDKIVCANGGYDFAKSIGVKPDIVVGDLDSKISKITEDVKLIKYPIEKDFSDFELAVNYSVESKPDKILVYGALGGRKDHEIINLTVLAYCDIPMIFIERYIEIYNIRKVLTIHNYMDHICSLVSFSEGTVIKKLEGFKYDMNNEGLKPSSRGLSNVIAENIAKIELSGNAVLFFLNKE